VAAVGVVFFSHLFSLCSASDLNCKNDVTYRTLIYSSAMAVSYSQSKYSLRRIRSGVVGMKRKHSEPKDSGGSSEDELEFSGSFNRYGVSSVRVL
jgi:hypothetical protein